MSRRRASKQCRTSVPALASRYTISALQLRHIMRARSSEEAGDLIVMLSAGMHGFSPARQGTKLLTPQQHAIRVDYFQVRSCVVRTHRFPRLSAGSPHGPSIEPSGYIRDARSFLPPRMGGVSDFVDFVPQTPRLIMPLHCGPLRTLSSRPSARVVT